MLYAIAISLLILATLRLPQAKHKHAMARITPKKRRR